MDFSGLLLTGPVCHINLATAPGVIGAGAGAATYAAATALTPVQATAAAAVNAAAANQALVAQ